MPAFCAVLNCSDKYVHSENISFHKFPIKRDDLLQQWLLFAQRGSNWKPSKWSSICSRHFRAEDFNSSAERKTLKKQAVPSVRLPTQNIAQEQTSEPPEGLAAKVTSLKVSDIETVEQREDTENHTEEEQFTILPKVNCRLCGLATSAVVTFSSNFEIFGMIQKCFPTLNIQQDDSLPKEMCRVCLKRLEGFSRFIDKVLETQSALHQQFRSSTEKPNNRAATERQLKIKQEPVVRVKQEVAEGFDSFLSDDMDMGVDESCDQDQDTAAVEQKYPFCDFPMLNTQDIINNCDIMEIINLDDPFIDIPDDDATNTTGDNITQQLAAQKLPQNLPSAHELLQTHLLIEEHNYAYAAEDFKEEWQIKNYYKTEKTEGYEQDEVEDLNTVEPEEEYHNYLPEENVQQSEMPGENTLSDTNNRSLKPIVTSVSAIAESRLQLQLPSQNSLVTAVNDLLQPNHAETWQRRKSSAKPNIVVLNESIVKSSSAFQLHACAVCPSKFFSVESLSQHYTHDHTPRQMLPPMVSVPNVNILPAVISEHNCKIEEGCEKNPNEYAANEPTEAREQLASLQNWQGNFPNFRNCASNEPPIGHSMRSTKTQINILEMQQTFSRTPPCFEVNRELQTDNKSNTLSYISNDQIQVILPSETTTTTTAHNDIFKLPAKSPFKISTPVPSNKCKRSSVTSHLKFKNNLKSSHSKSMTNMNLKNVAVDYLLLRKRYRQLQRKWQNLKQFNSQSTQLPQPTQEASQQSVSRKFPCRLCQQSFATIFQLLRHKQTAAAHHIQKPRTHFCATCAGCEKFFRSKIALRNHMRYICQSLSLRWFTTMKTFKCRRCRRITFTHWRLYRRHELRCKLRGLKAKKKLREVPKRKNPTVLGKSKIPGPSDNYRLVATPLKKQYPCLNCNKVFVNANNLNQHRITHSAVRSHKCGLCSRVFKRRNGLAQHMKGFHLQLKPFECPVCGKCYALKCDMLRCRHSLLKYSLGMKK